LTYVPPIVELSFQTIVKSTGGKSCLYKTFFDTCASKERCSQKASGAFKGQRKVMLREAGGAVKVMSRSCKLSA